MFLEQFPFIILIFFRKLLQVYGIFMKNYLRIFFFVVICSLLIVPFHSIGVSQAFAQGFSSDIRVPHFHNVETRFEGNFFEDNFSRTLLSSLFASGINRKLSADVEPIPSTINDDHQIFLPMVSNGKIVLDELSISSLIFPAENKTAHHTEQWPDYVFRRVQWVKVQVEFSGEFNETTDLVLWSVLGPNQETYDPVPGYSSELADTSWAVKAGNTLDGTRIDELFIPVKASLGEFRLKASLYRNAGSGFELSDEDLSPAFYVIFNPWNDDSDVRADTDVYNREFTLDELSWYALSGSDVNFYGGGSYDNASSVNWELYMYDPIVFFPVLDEVQGESSAREAMRKLVDKVRWNDSTPVPSEIIEGKWKEYTRINWRNVFDMMLYWNNGSAHPEGQCMDFGGLVAAFGKSIGVPTRMLTLWCIDCGFEFHVWNEVWLNEVNTSAWSPTDGMENVEASTRQDDLFEHFLYYIDRGIHLYTYDAISQSMIDVISEYR